MIALNTDGRAGAPYSTEPYTVLIRDRIVNNNPVWTKLCRTDEGLYVINREETEEEGKTDASGWLQG